MPTLAVKFMTGRLLAVLMGGGCLLCAVSFYATGQTTFAFRFLLGALPCALLWLTTGELQISGENITYISPLKKNRMSWDEVKEIEVDTQGSNMLLYGEDRVKRLAVPGAGHWRGKDRTAMLSTFDEEVKKRQIPMTYKMGIAWTGSKNTRIS
jgi:hypothetical protein